MNRRLLMRLLFAMILAFSLGAAACGDDGGSDGNNTGTGGTTTATTGDTSTSGTTGTTGTGTGEGTSTGTTTSAGGCADGCAPGEECVNDQCVAVNECESVGEECENVPDVTIDQLVAGDIICLPQDEQTNTCQEICNWDPEGEFEDCPSGSFCNPFTDNVGNPFPENIGRCILSDCDDPAQSASQCADAGPNGGTCFPLGNETFICLEAGATPVGGACESDSECASGSFCVDSVCSAICEVDGEACADGKDCLAILNSTDDYGLCLDGCPGFDSTDECGEGQGCFPLSSDTGLCTEVGEIPLGDPCDPEAGTAQCAQFGVCGAINEGDEPTCLRQCDLTGDDPDALCDDGDTCLTAFEGNDVVGLCFPGCTPLVSAEESGCEEPNGTCLPINGGSRPGICLESGDAALGEECGPSESVVGECAGNAICGEQDGENPGVCQAICATFSKQDGTESGCEEGEVCGLFNTGWGACTDNVAEPAIAPLQACTNPGGYCDDGVVCLQVDQQGNSLCLEWCRGAEGDGDCSGGTVCDTSVFDTDGELGICLPQ